VSFLSAEKLQQGRGLPVLACGPEAGIAETSFEHHVTTFQQHVTIFSTPQASATPQRQQSIVIGILRYVTLRCVMLSLLRKFILLYRQRRRCFASAGQGVHR
jgi:hypothetical protein